MKRISSLLKTRIGLNDEFVGQHVVGEAIRRRMAELKMRGVDEYADYLNRSAEEFDLLVDEAIVPESWFFRDVTPFRALVDHFRTRRASATLTKPWRILSAPCATGEEPYSIALSLLDAGFRAGDFAIEAVDISARLLRVAQEMVYRPISFRGAALGFRDRFFEKTASGDYRLRPALAGHVRFSRMNIVEATFAQEAEAYDVIFCRNLLIYLEEGARQKVVRHLHRLLIPGGMLAVGHAEAGVIPDDLFEPSNIPRSFAFYKLAKAVPDRRDLILNGAITPVPRKGEGSGFGPGRPGKASDSPDYRSGGALKGAANPPKRGAADALRSNDDPSGIPAGPGEFSAGGELAEIERLADAGKLTDAAELCGRYLHRHPACPNGLYLLGLVRMAENQQGEAETLFHQVVYLLPHHTEAMVHLAHLTKMRGDHQLSDRWRQRLSRIRQRTETE